MALVVTGGRLIFGGDTNGHFRALDADTGKVSWDVNLGSSVSGPPISYAVNGKQYIAVSTGGSLESRSLLRMTPDIHPSDTSAVFVFALP